MRQLLNTLFVTSEDIYLSLDGENVVANRGGETVARYPLHTLQSIVTFSYAGASPALMGKCAQREIGLAFCSQRGGSSLPACPGRCREMSCCGGCSTAWRMTHRKAVA